MVLLVAAQVPVFAQVGTPPGYPTGQAPNQGPPVPWPRRSKKNDADSKSVPTQHATGKLAKVDDQTVVVDVPDGRVLTFKRTEKTRFLRDDKEIKPGDLKPGDWVTVEATEDEEAYLYAVNVRYEKNPPAEAAPAEGAKPSTEGTAEGTAKPAETGGRAAGNIPAPEDEGPGPPRLKRGVPAPRKDEDLADASDVPGAPGAPPQVEERAPDADPLIEKAREATSQFTERLPNYVCTEFMARFASQSRPADWRALDVVSTNIVYEGGHESYREISVNGKPFKKGMEELSGSWSTGEFASMLLELFAPWTAAEFHLRRQGTVAGVEARVYGFEVERARSHWHIQVASQSILPAYKGSVWIEPGTGRVLRVEMQARALPKEFPMDTIESAIEYDNAMIGGRKYLLPVHAETLACERGTDNCTRNTIDFRNYHKFEANSDVTFK